MREKADRIWCGHRNNKIKIKKKKISPGKKEDRIILDSVEEDCENRIDWLLAPENKNYGSMVDYGTKNRIEGKEGVIIENDH